MHYRSASGVISTGTSNEMTEEPESSVIVQGLELECNSSHGYILFEEV